MVMRAVAVALFATACSGSDPAPEVVVTDASLGGAAPHVIGATGSSVFWTAGSMPSLVGGAAVATLPATGMQLASAAGPIAMAGDVVVYADGGRLARIGLTGDRTNLANAMPDAVAGTATSVAWSQADSLTWLVADAQHTVTLPKVATCDHLKITPNQIYVASDVSSTRRLLRVDQQASVATVVAQASTSAASFPGGGTTGATYTGRIIDADDAGVIWLVEELPTHRAIVVSEPLQGESKVVLSHVMNASGFFASPTDLYWQEGDELLTAPRAGGAASIITSLPGEAGALADGYIYYVHGMAIERLRVE